MKVAVCLLFGAALSLAIATGCSAAPTSKTEFQPNPDMGKPSRTESAGTREYDPPDNGGPNSSQGSGTR